MSTQAPALSTTHPVDADESQAHGHEDEAQGREAGGLDLGSGAEGLLVCRDDANVEDPRKDEDQSGGSGGSGDAEDVSDIGHKDDQQVDGEQ